mmetsp:Transcript_27381/g.51364  ORF Transcript_27381/g.51364 Transcript_27381/m.51364 type:complete len:311 (+) Transcript_27381:1568-2500(+)
MSQMFWTVSFSGAGHLLPYHLGVATALLRRAQQQQRLAGEPQSLSNTQKRLPPVHAVAGSSSGAIAATVMASLPHRVEEYSDRFLQDRGHAFRNLQQMLDEQKMNNHGNDETEGSTVNDLHPLFGSRSPLLTICTTKCSDGKMNLFSFDNTNASASDDILRAVQASCTIPRSFHPFDMWSRYALSYPDEEGIEIHGEYHVDGGIAAPVPPTPLDQDVQCSGTILVSPISGPSITSTTTSLSIRPKDTSVSLLPFSLTTTRCKPFQIRPSVQNLRAMVVAMGVASPNVLRDWYDRGMEDAHEFLETTWHST